MTSICKENKLHAREAFDVFKQTVWNSLSDLEDSGKSRIISIDISNKLDMNSESEFQIVKLVLNILKTEGLVEKPVGEDIWRIPKTS